MTDVQRDYLIFIGQCIAEEEGGYSGKKLMKLCKEAKGVALSGGGWYNSAGGLFGWVLDYASSYSSRGISSRFYEKIKPKLERYKKEHGIKEEFVPYQSFEKVVETKQDVKNQDLKNWIEIEKIGNTVKVVGINLMGLDEIKSKYGKEIRLEYSHTLPNMMFVRNSRGGWLSVYAKSNGAPDFRLEVGNEFSQEEWNKIWKLIKECGHRLSEIIKKAKEPKREKWYV